MFGWPIALLLVAGLGPVGGVLVGLLGLYAREPSWPGRRARASVAPDPGVEARLKEHVVAISEGFGPRDHEHLDGLASVASYVRRHLALAGAAVDDQLFDVGGTIYTNVIGRFPGRRRDPKLPRIVVGAHYDTCGPQPGADDNASGVAALLELARRLGERETELPIELVAYCLEEPPHFRTEHMGSRVHASRLAATGAEVKLMLSLEMLGCYDDRPGSQRFPSRLLSAVYPRRADFLLVVSHGAQRGLARRVREAMSVTALPIYSLTAPRSVPGIDWSDHQGYWDHGMPALMITDTSFYRNPRYHTTADTWDTLDFARMAMAVEAVVAAVYAVGAES